MRIEYHRTLIADRVRNEAFHRALQAHIVPGKTIVADIGAGTGLIGVLAAKLGAREVYLYEVAEVAGVAEAVIRANGVANCHLFPCHSTEMVDPPRADLIVSETLGNYALEENIIATLSDARKRHMKRGGVIVPSSVVQFVAPVVSPRIHQELTVWRGTGLNIDLSAAEQLSLNNIYVRSFTANELFETGRSAVMWDRLDLKSTTSSRRAGTAAWQFSKATEVFGFALWWEATLTAGVSLSTAPGSPVTHWEQLYLPLLAPMSVERGQTIEVKIRSQSSEAAGTHLAWSAARRHDGKVLEKQDLDLDRGYLP